MLYTPEPMKTAAPRVDAASVNTMPRPIEVAIFMIVTRPRPLVAHDPLSASRRRRSPPRCSWPRGTAYSWWCQLVEDSAQIADVHERGLARRGTASAILASLRRVHRREHATGQNKQCASPAVRHACERSAS